MIPSGTVALLFTDIESSVARWEKHPEAMREAIELHDTMLRRAIEAEGGYVFKTVGDAFCAAFPTSAAAICAAVEAQRSLLEHNWSSVGGLHVRMAVHTGAADLRDGDYFGRPVNRVARLLSIARGGQILVSGIAKELSEDSLPATVSLRDLGAHRLRDLAHPEQVYQVLAPGLTADFAPPASLEALPNNLPLQLTPFFGREAEIELLHAAIEDARLVTLLGSGGVGKTRLSLHAAADLLDAFPGGVWFVDFALLRDGAHVPRAVAQVCGVELDLEGDRLDAIVSALRTKRALLIFDNCEHVIEGAALCAEAILRGCPSVRILATSRQGLGFAGERVIRLPSLGVPPPGADITVAAASRFDAVALFVDRAIAATGSFELTVENVDAVVDICRRLDGIALAIELAAARLKMLSVEQLRSRLNERFRLLTGGSRTALARQQTMRALIDWSYDLLSEPERALFRRSAAFNGTFSIEAGAYVCSEPTADTWEYFDVLAGLVDKSMISAELYQSEQRYRLLESTRQYALERLAASGERDAVLRRHAEFYLRFTEDAERRYFNTPLKAWLVTVDPEADNVRSALAWAIAENETALAARIASAFAWYWLHGKQLLEPIATLEQLLAAWSGDARLEARCSYALAYLLNQAGDENRARGAAERAIRAAQQCGDRECLAHALVCEASVAFMDKAYDGETAFKKAIDIFGEIGNHRMIGIATGRLARSLGVRGDLEAAGPLYQRALSMSRAAGDDRTTAVVLSNLAEIEFNTGNPQVALRYAGEALEFAFSARYEPLVRTTYANMVVYLMHEGLVDDALDRARMALHLAREIHSAIGISLLALHFAGIAAERDDSRIAAVLLGHYLPAFRAIYGPERDLERTERVFYERTLERLRNDLPEDELNRLLRLGAELGRDEVLSRMLEVA